MYSKIEFLVCTVLQILTHVKICITGPAISVQMVAPFKNFQSLSLWHV